MTKTWTIFFAALVAACGGSDGNTHLDAKVSDGGADAPAASMDITGTGTLTAQADTGLLMGMFDFTNTTITTITPDGAGFDHRTGSGTNATFTAPVGQGAPLWYLSVQFSPQATPFYLVGNSTAPDYSQYDFGRSDKAFPAATTNVTVNVTGMNAWGALDDLEIMSSNVGAMFFSPQASFATKPTAGATTINAQTFDWSTQPEPLVQSAKGDTAVMFQLSTKTNGANQYAAIAKSGTATGFTQTEGQTATMTVAMAAVTQNKNLTVNWKRSQFAALAGQAGTGGTPALQGLFLDAMPAASARGFYGFTGAPDLVEFFPAAGSTDITATFTYGNPFSTMSMAWDEFVIAAFQYNISVKASGASGGSPLSGGYYGLIPVSSLVATGDIAPQISGVQNLKVAGKDATTAEATVGMTPTITWDAPSAGTATGYSVFVIAVKSQNGMTSLATAASFTTKGTSLQIPDGVLVSGTSYVIQVIAFAVPGADFTVKPFQNSLPYAQFSTVSAQFSP